MTREIKQAGKWDAEQVRDLRYFLRLTQGELARRLGARQQTVSEWEVGKYRPRGMSVALLDHLAQETGFRPASEHLLRATEQRRG